MTRQPQHITLATDDPARRKPGSERRHPVQVRPAFLRLPRPAGRSAA